MSEQMTFDRKKGFVALPVEVLDIDLSPGAFRTLVELCRMANAEGFCWPSLGQLSDRMGRSRAAISGYVRELRTADLIATEEQKMANGYNYRLKYRVTFWQSWRASLVGQTARKSERSVQLDERPKEIKNQSHKIQVRGHLPSDLDRLLSTWANCFHGAPYPSTRKPIPSDVLNTSRQMLANRPVLPKIISADIARHLSDLWSDLKLPVDAGRIAAQAQHMERTPFTEEELGLVLAHIRKAWPAHWRKIPTLEQFEKLIKSSGIVPLDRKLSLLEGYHKRWDLAEKHLRRPLPFCSVTPKTRSQDTGWQTQKYPRI